MIGIATWLLGSQIGRQVLIWGTIALTVMTVVWRIYAAGQAKERARQLEASLRNLRTRVKVDDEITKLPADERRKKLESWASD